MDNGIENSDELFRKAMELIDDDERNVDEPGFLDSDAFQLLLKAAEANHPEAQYLVGKAYCSMSVRNWETYDQNAEMGWEWYRRSADNGYQRAILTMAEGEY